MIKIAILDDYADAALKVADWSKLHGKAEIVAIHHQLPDPETVILRLQSFDVICVMRERTPLPRHVIERLPNLKLIVTTGKPGNLSIDGQAAAERGIPICGTGPGAVSATAELAWGLILSLARHIPFEAQAIREDRWQSTMGVLLEGRTLGIIGLGKLGSRMARYGKAFGMNLLAWSQNMTAEPAAHNGARLVTKDELFRESDFITVQIKLGERTKKLIGVRELELMKSTAYLVNTSRSAIIDSEALLEALRSRRIAGAGLDVFDQEPLPPDHELRRLDNVVLAPHLGYVVEETFREFYQDTVDDILAWLDGRPIRQLELPK